MTSVQDEIEKFVQNLQSMADHIHLKADVEHVAVKLLAFNSRESDHHAKNRCQYDLERYKDVFDTKYGFHTELFLIPEEQSAVKFQCGDYDIDWCHQQKILENSAFNTLIILDTCDSGFAYRLATHKGPGSLEFLTASGFSGWATSPGPESFSSALCSTLEDLAAESFTVSRLYERILCWKSKFYETPFYARLSTSGPEIRLQSVKARYSVTRDEEKIRTIRLNLSIDPSQDDLDPIQWKDWIESYAPRDILEIEFCSNKASGSYSFGIRVKVMASFRPDYVQWTRWIDNAPTNLQSIGFDIEQASSERQEDSIALFVEQLNFKLGINENLGRSYYQNVTVLPIMWKKPTLNYLRPEEKNRNDMELSQVRDELEGISDVFKDDFHYHVKSILELSADDTYVAECELVDGINELTRLHGGDTSSLLIIVYGGHGEDTRHNTAVEGDCVWVANVSPKSACVNWTVCGINLLDVANCDTIMILDCCFSGTAARGVSKKTTKILAAATRNEPSWSGPRAYSKLLKRKLKEKSIRPFTAFELHEEMLVASKAPLSGDPNNLEATPDHGFTRRSRPTSILLKPLDKGLVHTITDNRPFAVKPTRQRIFLEVELDQLQRLEDCVSEWGNWFTRRHPPPNMCGVKLYTPEDVFVKAIIERNALVKRLAESEDQDGTMAIER
ncbi:MAG: hypothetical protein Q9165_008626 [Trypethelium subeluteriae]